MQKEVNHLLHDGYRYRKARVLSDGNSAWRCLKRNCCARLRVGVTGNIISESKHNHESASNPNEIEKAHHTGVNKTCEIIPQISGTSLVVPHNITEPTPCDRMEYTKKFILVEPREMDKPMPDKILSKLDREMHEIIHRNLAEVEKAKLYSESLSRYLTLDKPTTVTNFISKDVQEEPDSCEDAKESVDIESTIIDMFPKKLQSHASRLLNYIKTIPHIRWSETGELMLKNTIIAKSHVIELISEMLRKGPSNAKPVGWKLFVEALRDYNIPRELIGNAEKWKIINNETTSVTPKRTSCGKRQRKHIDWESY